MFNFEKTLETILYISEKSQDLYKILKIIYFSDIIHLKKFGRFITEDNYIAMENGPVPSGAYDIIKMVRDNFPFNQDYKDAVSASLKVTNRTSIQPKRKFNEKVLSKSEIAAIDQSIKENIGLTFNELKNKSHDFAHKNADVNGLISVKDIVEMIGDKDLSDYYNSYSRTVVV
ncbi:MAG: Panacea domain-containing protein [Melioribacteraceae bacterium]